MASIPEDIIIDIFYRLPVKSLLRFRSLSKKFCSIIEDPDFIRRQYNTSIDNKSNRSLIVLGSNKSSKQHLYSIDLDSTILNDYRVKKLELPLDRSCMFFVMGCCDGILALSYANISLCFWNLSTQKYRVLPNLHRAGSEYCYEGFDRDVATDDYKFVSIDTRTPDDESFPPVIVYGLRADTWRVIDDHPNHHYSHNESVGTLVGGTLNWLVKFDDEVLILSFDIQSEKFCTLSVPVPVYDIFDHNALNVLDGCLCLNSRNHGVHEIWVMKEYGVKESWEKSFSFCLYPKQPYSLEMQFLKALICSKHGDKVFRCQHKGDDVFDQQDKSVVIINGWPKFVRQEIVYVDSLISPSKSSVKKKKMECFCEEDKNGQHE